MDKIIFNRQEIIKVHQKFLSEVNKLESIQKNKDGATVHMTESTFVKTTYSTKSFEKLQKINIKNLIIDKTHHGFYLKGKLFVECGKVNGITSILQDENDDLVRISIYNFPIPKGVDYRQVIKKDRIIYIKEPYYKMALDGMLVVRVDSPEDIIFDELILASKKKTCEDLKNEGNKAFERKEFEEALLLYDQALDLKADDIKIIAVINSNKAACLLNLCRFEQALESAKIAITLDPSYLKARFRFNQALIELGRFDEAIKEIKVLNQNLSKKELEDLMKKIEKYKKNISGIFDWGELLQAYFEQKSVEIANYLNPKLIIQKSIIASGLGVFAKENLKKGELLVVEKSIAFISNREIAEYSKKPTINFDFKHSEINSIDRVLLKDKVLNLCLKDPFKKTEIFQLFTQKNIDDDINIRKSKAQQSNIINADIISAIVRSNVFGVTSFQMLYQDQVVFADPSGLWLNPSYFNHSCIPNATYYHLDSVMIIRALTDISSGQELFLTYIDSNLSYEDRQKKLKNWEFECKCPKCEVNIPKKVEIQQFEAIFNNVKTNKKKKKNSLSKSEALYSQVQKNDRREIIFSILMIYMETDKWRKYFDVLIDHLEWILSEKSKKFSSIY